MGQLFYNGLHWNAGGPNESPRPQYLAGQQFSAAMVLAVGNIAVGNDSTNDNGWRDICSWLRNNTSRTADIVLRLFWPSGNTISGDVGPSLGEAFYREIVRPAIDSFGIQNFQVLNELNIEYEGSKPRSQIRGDMFNIAARIKQLATEEGRGPIFLGFPGPGGPAPTNPTDPAWNSYWDDYSSAITQGTDDGAAYNWLGVHCYEITPGALNGRMQGQYNSLIQKFPGYSHRWTEYGIPFDGGGYCGVPCDNTSAFQNRANDCRSAIQGFKGWVDQQGGPNVFSVHYYLAHDSNASSQLDGDTRFELVRDNNNLGPAQTLADAF